MGALIGEAVEGIIRGIQGAIDRRKLGEAFVAFGEGVKRGDLVSDEALENAQKTLDRLRDVRDRFK